MFGGMGRGKPNRKMRPVRGTPLPPTATPEFLRSYVARTKRRCSKTANVRSVGYTGRGEIGFDNGPTIDKFSAIFAAHVVRGWGPRPTDYYRDYGRPFRLVDYERSASMATRPHLDFGPAIVITWRGIVIIVVVVVAARTLLAIVGAVSGGR